MNLTMRSELEFHSEILYVSSIGDERSSPVVKYLGAVEEEETVDEK